MISGIECLAQVNKRGSDNLVHVRFLLPVIHCPQHDFLGAMVWSKTRLCRIQKLVRLQIVIYLAVN